MEEKNIKTHTKSTGESVNNKHAIFVVSQKGGVGKTTWSRAYLDLARKDGLSVAAYDADGQVGQLFQYHGTRTNGVLDKIQDPLTGVKYFDVRNEKQRDEIINAANTKADIILMDMPGGSVQEMAKILGDTNKDTIEDKKEASQALVAQYVQQGYDIYIVVVISNVISSVRTVTETINLFGSEAKYIVVKNEAFGNADDFSVFDGYEDAQGKKRHGKGKESLLKVGGQVIVMPRMHPNTYGMIDVESIPFTKVKDLEHILLADKARVERWLSEFKKSIKETPLAL